MNPHMVRRVAHILSALLAIGVPFLAACNSADRPAGPDAARPGVSQADPAQPTPAASQAPFAPADACALLTKADVESLTGKKALDGRKEQADQLVTCAFDDPTSPQVAGRALSQVMTVSVMTGREGAYYKGAVAQVHDAFQQFRESAGGVQSVTGIGEDAYWNDTLRTLTVVKDKYLLTIDVDAGDENLAAAKSAATKALDRLSG